MDTQITKVDNLSMQITKTPAPIVTTVTLDSLINRSASERSIAALHTSNADALDAQIAQAQALGIQTQAQVQQAKLQTASIK